MINFDWIFEQQRTETVRDFLLKQGVTKTILKNTRYHGGQIKVNGKPVFQDFVLKFGDQVELDLCPEPRNQYLRSSNRPLSILFENRNYLVVEKPQGVPTVTSRIYKNDTLTNRVLAYYLKQNYPSKTVHVVNRLDKNTSGPVIFAKNALAHALIDRQLVQHQVRKEYEAVVDGLIPFQHGKIFLPIGRAKDSFVKRAVVANGKPSETEFWRETTSSNRSLLRIRLHTGRTHQIRVHMAAVGFPLIGDWLYNPKDNGNPMMLHCFKISFFDSIAKKQVDVVSKTPACFRNAVSD